MYIEGKVNNAYEFYDILKAKALEAGYECISDRTLNATNITDVYNMDHFRDSTSRSFYKACMDPNSQPSSNGFGGSSGATLTFNKDVGFDRITFYSVVSDAFAFSIYGVNEHNQEYHLADIPNDSYKKLEVKIQSEAKFRKLHFKNLYCTAHIEIFLKNGSFIYKELVLKKVVGTKELLYIFVLDDDGDRFYLHMSPIKSFNPSKAPCILAKEHIGAMDSLVKVVLPTGEFGYSLSLQDRRICGAINTLNPQVFEPFYIGLLKPYPSLDKADPFLCFGLGDTKKGLADVSKDGISYPYSKYKNEFLQCISTPNWTTPPTEDNIYSNVNEPFALPIFVCYFGRYDGSKDLGGNIKERAERLVYYGYESTEAKMLGEMDGMIAIILGDGIEVGDTLSIDTKNYKIITAGSDITNRYCYALIKE
ncbi:Uncharacterised protein [Campylobacter hyointestinalis subsp. hyointestinalis]|uniref:Uncharacterized protein n=1 Tax=Campylobacter hyointestinalis subsp. hyointestinalis TaxID=91352 RepID=A0A0S4SA78_CAMHY|nr:hypothetical protein [Campylobacter hyointestinalis]CUU83270.1 Uncharacterised protein [Campylobacter hyointestinalis subsp. hyointestinalis]